MGGPWNAVSKVRAPINIISKEAGPLEMYFFLWGPVNVSPKARPPIKCETPLVFFRNRGLPTTNHSPGNLPLHFEKFGAPHYILLGAQ